MTSIISLVQQQQQTLDNIEGLIAEEHKAISNNDFTLLTELSSSKNELLLQLQQTDQQISQSANNKKISSNLRKQIKSIQRQLKKCQQLNDINAQQINYYLAGTNRFIQALQECTTPQGTTYNQQGKTLAGALSNKNIKA